MKLGLLANEEFIAAVNTLTKKELSPSLSYKLSKITEQIQVEQRRYLKTKEDFIQKYAKKDDKGQPLVKPSSRPNFVEIDFGDNAETFVKELTEFENQEVSIASLGSVEDFVASLEKYNEKISSAHLNSLKSLFEVPAQDK